MQQCESVIPEHIGREGRQDRRTVGKLGWGRRRAADAGDNAESGPLLTENPSGLLSKLQSLGFKQTNEQVEGRGRLSETDLLFPQRHLGVHIAHASHYVVQIQGI